MRIVFDPAKDAVNKEVHEVSLAVGRIVLETRIADRASPVDYGEARRIALGLVNGRLFACVYTRRGDTYRIVSVRPASRQERKR